MRRFWAIFYKECRQVRRDPFTLGILMFMPALLLALYGYALSFDVKHIRVAVLDEDNTPDSRLLLGSLFGNPYFDRAGNLDRRQDADLLLQRGKARAVLVIPRGYSKALVRGGDARVQALVDATDANTASTAILYLEALADRLSRQMQRQRLRDAGLSAEAPIVTPEPRIWFNPELQSARFLVPGLIGVLMMLSGVVATSLSIVREKERETIEQIMVSPVKAEELILGKTLPYVLIGIATMAFILLLDRALFGVEVRGSFLNLAVTTLLFLFAALGMGVLISSVTRTQEIAFEIAVLSSLLPSLLLSGLIFPIKNMPVIVQTLSYGVVARYFIEALRGIILKAAPASVLWPQWAGLLILGVLFNVVAARQARKTF